MTLLPVGLLVPDVRSCWYRRRGCWWWQEGGGDDGGGGTEEGNTRKNQAQTHRGHAVGPNVWTLRAKGTYVISISMPKQGSDIIAAEGSVAGYD